MGVGWEPERWDELYRDACGFSIKWPQIKVFRLTSVEAAKLFPDKSLDLVYIDGDHRTESVIADITSWLPKIRKGGIISGHDYSHGWVTVRKGVDHHFKGKHNKERGSVWWVRL
jgi:hypothetical protein